VVSVSEDDKSSLQDKVQGVETDHERCSFTATDDGMMIYLGDQGGEGISEQDLQTAAKIDRVLAAAG
jgi:hypothetical protein